MPHDPERALGELEAVCRARGALVGPEFVERVGRHVADACWADGFLFLRTDPDSGLWLDVGHGGLPDGQCGAYMERAFLTTPWGDHGEWARGRERCRAVTPSSCPDPYVEHVVRSFGFAYEWHLNIAARGVCRGHLTLSRATEPFPPHVEGYLRRANAVLCDALRRIRIEESIGSIPGEGVGLIAVEHDGRLQAANARGAELLAEADAAGAAHVAHRFAAVGHLVARGSGRLPSHLMFVDREGYRYRVGAEPLLPGTSGWAGMLVVEPLRAFDSRELLVQLGLTEREASVALCVLRGLSSGHGSQSLAMAEQTWLSHLKQVYRKLGVGSRSELASVLVGT